MLLVKITKISIFPFPDTRETSYVHAVTSAGVTFAITQACSSGQIQDCPCDRSLNGKEKHVNNYFCETLRTGLP